MPFNPGPSQVPFLHGSLGKRTRTSPSPLRHDAQAPRPGPTVGAATELVSLPAPLPPPPPPPPSAAPSGLPAGLGVPPRPGGTEPSPHALRLLPSQTGARAGTGPDRLRRRRARPPPPPHLSSRRSWAAGARQLW